MTQDPIRAFVASYEFRADEGDHTPNENERALLEDAIHGWEAARLSPPPAASVQVGGDDPLSNRAPGVLQDGRDFVEQWRSATALGNGHDMAANTTTVRRFIRVVDSLDQRLRAALATNPPAAQDAREAVAKALFEKQSSEWTWEQAKADGKHPWVQGAYDMADTALSALNGSTAS